MTPLPRRATVVRAVVATAAATLAVAGCSGDEPADQPTAASSAPAPTSSTETAAEPAPTDSATDAEVGGLVEGFPTDVVPVPDGAEVTLSAVVPAEGGRQVSLAGTTSQAPEEIVAFYTEALAAQEFTVADTPRPEGVAGATFTRADGTEVLVLTVVTVDAVQQFSIGGFIAGG